MHGELRRRAPDPASGRTLAELIRCGERLFRRARIRFGHGLPGAYHEAAFIALHVLGIAPGELDAHVEKIPGTVERRRILRLFRKRIATRKPTPYLTGEAWLGDFRFRVNESVLVPRSYIAELLEDRLAPWVRYPQRVRSTLDLCTGSGCLAIMLAHAFPKARVDASDISPAALRLARRNVKDYGLEDRVRLIRSDLFAALGDNRYDVIVSNPPYVTVAAMRRLPPEHRHEPRLALAGGRDGLDLVRAIVRDAARHLTRNGLLVVEVGHARSRVERAFPRTPFIWPVTSGGDDCVFVIGRDELASGKAP